MCSGVGSRVLLDWVSPFGHPRITAWLPTPRGLSQAPTSFIGSWCQDIHRLPLVACHTTNTTKMLASTIQFSKYGQEHQPQPPPTSKNLSNQGKHTQRKDPHQRFGEDCPQPHNHTGHDPQTSISQCRK